MNSIGVKLHKIKNYYLNNACYLGRIACLGNFVLNRYFDSLPIQYRYRLLNAQKMRVDIFIDYINKCCSTPNANSIKKYFARKDIWLIIKNQQSLIWLKKKKIKAFFMDSFSELVDQNFIYNKDVFCCYYTDIIHNEEFDKNIICKGLLPSDELEVSYRRFFDWFEKYYTNTPPPPPPVFFFHFSTKLDTRESFHEREMEIKRIMMILEKEKSYIHNIFINEKDILKNETDEFPYHYSDYTYNKYFNKLKEIMNGMNYAL